MFLQYKVPSLTALMFTVSSTAALAGQLPSSVVENKVSLSAQISDTHVCGTDKNKQDWHAIQKDNQLQLKQKLTQSMMKMSAQPEMLAVNGNGVDGRYYIPVVVHVYGDQYNY